MRKIVIYLLVVLCYFTAYSQDDEQDAEFKLALNLFNDGRFDLAAEHFENFINTYPTTTQGIEARFYLGLAQLKLKKYDEAQLTFKNFALNYLDHPKAPETWLKIAEAFVAMNNYEEAAASYERVKLFHAKSPLVPEALLNAAILHRQLNNIDLAKKNLRTVLQDYPTSQFAPVAQLMLAEVYSEIGQSSLAEIEAKRVIESSTNDTLRAKALLFIGSLKLSLSFFDDAESIFTALIDDYPHTDVADNATVILAELFKNNAQYDKAIRYFQQVLWNTPVDSVKAKALYNIALSYNAMNNLSEARNILDTLITKYSHIFLFRNALYQAGMVAIQQQEYQDASDYFKRILSREINDHLERKAIIRLAEVAKTRGLFNESVSWYNLYLQRFPQDLFLPEVLYNIGLMLKDNQRDCRLAIKYFNQFEQKFSNSLYIDDVLFAQGECAESIGDFEGALGIYNNLLHRYPAFSKSGEVLKRIKFIEHYKRKSHDAGIEKLAKIIGGLVSQTSKADAAFQLGEVYFYDLKDYASAAQQFTIAIDNGINAEKLINAYFLRARSYHLESQIDSSVAEKAIIYYDLFLNEYPTSELSADAAYYSFQLKLSLGKIQPHEVVSQMNELLSKPLLPQYREELLYTVGIYLISFQMVSEGLKILNQLLSEFPKSQLSQDALFKRGNLLLEQSLIDSSLQDWEMAVENLPNGFFTTACLKKIADIYFQLDRPVDALIRYQRIINEFPYSDEAVESNLPIIKALTAAGRYDEATQALQNLIEIQRNYPFDDIDTMDTILLWASVLQKQGNKQKAVSLYNQYLYSNRKGNKASQAYYALGIIARADGKKDDAAFYFKQAALLGAEATETEEIAELLFMDRQYEKSANQYAKLAQATKLLTKRKAFKAKQIIATLRMENMPEAQKLINEFYKLFGKEIEYQTEFEYEKALYYYRQKDYLTARKLFESVVNDYEGTQFKPWGFYYIGKIFEVTNNFDLAKKQFTAILNDYPSSDVISHVHFSLGNILLNAEQYEDAIRHYKQILSNPEKAGDILPLAMNNIIQAYESAGLYDFALKTTRDFIEHYPQDESVINKKIKIGILYTKLKYYDQAIIYLQNLLSEGDSSLEAEIRYYIGEAYYYKDNYQQAILEFLKIPYLKTRHDKINWTASALFMAGHSYEKMSKIEEAIEMYQQIIDRPGIDDTLKIAAQKEIERIQIINKNGLQ